MLGEPPLMPHPVSSELERRSFLRWAIGVLFAGGAALTAVNFMEYLERPQLVTVKTIYFQMQQFTNVSEEYFDLPNPASIRNLLNTIVQRHPTLSPPMMATMLILVNDSAVSGLDTDLNDGDVIDFIPVVAGG
jgi:molybdopterin converting factor small subunit